MPSASRDEVPSATLRAGIAPVDIPSLVFRHGWRLSYGTQVFACAPLRLTSLSYPDRDDTERITANDPTPWKIAPGCCLVGPSPLRRAPLLLWRRSIIAVV